MELIQSLILGILLLFVLLFIILMIYYFVAKNKLERKSQDPSKRMLPPPQYMRNVGIRCPDYWEDLGRDPSNTNNHLCRNTFNIPVANSQSSDCYSNQGDSTMSFVTAENSDFNNNYTLKSGAVNNERCKFVQNCGPTANEDAAWLGIMSGKNSYTKCVNIPTSSS